MGLRRKRVDPVLVMALLFVFGSIITVAWTVHRFQTCRTVFSWFYCLGGW
jgi:hypothetical protein